MADYYQLKNQNIFNPPANTDMGNANSQFNTMYVQNALVLGNVSVTGTTIIAPRISSIAYPGNDTAADTAGGQTITLNGTGFVAGASVLINGSAVGVVSVVSSTVITFTSPANTTGSYVVYVINPDGSTAIAIPGIQYSGTPTWTTAAGTLGNVYETDSFTQTVTATGDAPITYSVVSGSLPPGSTFNANGTITGTSQLSASPTTYSFTVRATDAEQQDTNRAFSIAVIPDVVTWSSPTANATYTPAANVAMANITLSATSAVGSGITYSANTLPTGLSLTGANISGTPTVVANTSSLLTATANTTSESSSITINWSVSVASDPYFMYNSLLLPGTGTNGAQNNTFLDGSTNNFTVTRYGNTTQGTFSPYGSNWSNYFSGGYLTFTGTSAVNLYAAQFTFECWVYKTSTGLPQHIYGYNNATLDYWDVYIDTSERIVFRYNGNSANITTSTTVPLAQWTHIAIAYDGSTSRIFINGILAGSAASGIVTANGNYPANIGINLYSGGVSPFYGYMSNMRIIKGSALYTANFTPSTAPLTAISGTSLLTCQSNIFKDNSTNAFTLTVTNSPTVQRFSPFSPGATYSTSTIGGSGYFDGSGDYLTAPRSTLCIPGASQNFTIEAWVYSERASGVTQQQIMGFHRQGVSSDWVFGINSSNYPDFYLDATGTLITSSIIVNPYSWNHIAVVRKDTNTITIYVNGVAGVTATTASTLIGNGANPLSIGSDYNGASFVTKGYITDARIVNGTALYTSNFVPPTAPLTAVSGTQFLLNYTNAGIIDNTMLNNLETVGNAQISTGQTKFGGGSMYFDGTGDALALPASINLALGTGNFTIEMWVYGTNDGNVVGGSYSRLFTLGTAQGTGCIETYNAAGTIVVGITTGTLITFAGSTLLNSTWNHFAITRSGSSVKAFVNGTQVGSTGTDSTNINLAATTQSWIGGISASSGNFTGYIDDFRITKGIARYTTTFTPATSAFPTY